MKKYIIAILLIMSIIPACYRNSNSSIGSVEEVMDDIVTRYYETLSQEQLDTIGSALISFNPARATYTWSGQNMKHGPMRHHSGRKLTVMMASRLSGLGIPISQKNGVITIIRMD